MLNQIFRPKILFAPKVFWDQKFVDTKFLGPNIFGPKEFFDQTKIFVDQTFFWTQILYGPNIFVQKEFFDQTFILAQNLEPKFVFSV